MTIVNIHQAKTHLSKLLEEVMQGHEVVIAKAGVPIAVIQPIASKKSKRVFGAMKGEFKLPKNFDAPLSDESFDHTLFPSKKTRSK